MARRTVQSEWRAMLLRVARTADADLSRYRDRPDLFARECLGVTITEEQSAILMALVHSDRVTVRSGRRVGKSMLAGVAAIWFASTRGPRARVVLTATTFQQVQEIVWKETRWLYQGAKVDLGGSLAVLAATGLRWDDGRNIIGVTADRAEGFQGLAAPEIMFIVDEASGVEERIYTALIGNLAGGGKLLMIGNPTQASGFFFESHKSEKFEKFHLPSTCSPNIVQHRRVVPGLADDDFLELSRSMWGVESPMYRIHVLGEFVEGLEGRLFPPDLIASCERRWAETRATGPLTIGVDPAGDGTDGDESGFACRRGQKITRMYCRRGLSPEAHLIEILGLMASEKGDAWEMTRVIVDRDGAEGAKLWGVLLGYLETHKDAFHLVGIRGSEPAKRKPREINHVRDEMWFALKDAMSEGLAVPTDLKLEGDLAAIRFDKLVNGKATVIKKPIIRRELGRSPDLGDAVCLAAFEGPGWIDAVKQESALDERRPPPGERETRGGAIDPYASYDGGSGGFDPYAR